MKADVHEEASHPFSVAGKRVELSITAASPRTLWIRRSFKMVEPCSPSSRNRFRLKENGHDPMNTRHLLLTRWFARDEGGSLRLCNPRIGPECALPTTAFAEVLNHVAQAFCPVLPIHLHGSFSSLGFTALDAVDDNQVLADRGVQAVNDRAGI